CHHAGDALLQGRTADRLAQVAVELRVVAYEPDPFELAPEALDGLRGVGLQHGARAHRAAGPRRPGGRDEVERLRIADDPPRPRPAVEADRERAPLLEPRGEAELLEAPQRPRRGDLQIGGPGEPRADLAREVEQVLLHAVVRAAELDEALRRNLDRGRR